MCEYCVHSTSNKDLSDLPVNPVWVKSVLSEKITNIPVDSAKFIFVGSIPQRGNVLFVISWGKPSFFDMLKVSLVNIFDALVSIFSKRSSLEHQKDGTKVLICFLLRDKAYKTILRLSAVDLASLQETDQNETVRGRFYVVDNPTGGKSLQFID